MSDTILWVVSLILAIVLLAALRRWPATHDALMELGTFVVFVFAVNSGHWRLAAVMAAWPLWIIAGYCARRQVRERVR